MVRLLSLHRYGHRSVPKSGFVLRGREHDWVFVYEDAEALIMSRLQPGKVVVYAW